MKLQTKIRTLGPVNHRALKQSVGAVAPDVWLEDEIRQNAFTAHRSTQSIILLFTDGWPNMRIEKRRGWDLLWDNAGPLIDEIVGAHFRPNGVVIRAMVAKLVAGGEIGEHMDRHPSFAIAHRIHVPLATNDQVEFMIAEEPFKLSEGVAYEVSNLDYHAVHNRSSEDRVHFIFDYVEK